jgi:hypothetical protein
MFGVEQSTRLGLSYSTAMRLLPGFSNTTLTDLGELKRAYLLEVVLICAHGQAL